MIGYKAVAIHPKLSQIQAECLLKALENEWDRFNDTIAINRLPTGNSSIASDYEYDSIRLDDLITEIKSSLRNLTFKENSLGYVETGFIIATLDHEFDAYKEKKSSLNEEECNCIRDLREKLKKIAVVAFGDDVLTIGHYVRGKNDPI